MDYKSKNSIFNNTKTSTKENNMNKTAVITGSTSNIAIELARKLLDQQYSLILIARNQVQSSQLKTALLRANPKAEITTIIQDLADFSLLNGLATKLKQRCNSIELLMLNAGVLVGTKQFNKQNIELHFALNCLSPYLLTRCLLPILSNNADVIVSGSKASQMVDRLELPELINPGKFKAMTGAYAKSKASIKPLMQELAINHGNINFSVIDLGPTKTKMADNQAMPWVFRIFKFLFSTPANSAQTLINAINKPKINLSHRTVVEDEFIKKINLLTDKFI